MLRSVAVSVVAYAVVVAAGASAHTPHFNAPSGLRGPVTPSSGATLISAQPPSGPACTATSIPTQLEYSDVGAIGIPGSGLIDEYIRSYSRIGVADAEAWSQFIPVTLRPFLHTVNFNWPTAHDIDSAGYDLEIAYFQGLRSAGCEAQNVAVTPLLRAGRSAAPEPATWAMLILGVAMVGLAARRRSQVAG